MKQTPPGTSRLYFVGMPWLLTFVCSCVCAANADTLRVPILSPDSLEQWEAKSFQGQTHYTPVTIDGHKAIKAQSRKAASGLVRKVKVDLTATPYMHWNWRVDNVLQDTDEKTRQGDDYPARVYVIVSGGWFFWQTRALNYVWSSNQPVDSTWPNAYTGNAVMLAVRSGSEQTGQWLHQSKNVLEDLTAYMHKSYTHIDAVAIMTDTDNSGQHATAYYGEIYFSNESTP